MNRGGAILPLLALLIPLAAGCGGKRAVEETPLPATAAEIPSAPPIADEDAKSVVGDFVAAMNAKDNLQLVRMIKPGGRFILATPEGMKTMDSNEFLAFFQDGLRKVGMAYGVEIRELDVRPKPGGAVVRVDMVESWNRLRFESKTNFHLEEEEGSIRIVGMDGAK